MGKGEIIATIIESVSRLSENDKVRGMIFGTYSDGTPRSIPDAISDEQLSPKSKVKLENKMEKKRKKKKYAKFKL